MPSLCALTLLLSSLSDYIADEDESKVRAQRLAKKCYDMYDRLCMLYLVC